MSTKRHHRCVTEPPGKSGETVQISSLRTELAGNAPQSQNDWRAPRMLSRRRLIAFGLLVSGIAAATSGIGAVSGAAAAVFAGLVLGFGVAAGGLWVMIRRSPIDAPPGGNVHSTVDESLSRRMERLEDMRWQLGDSAERLRELLDAQDDLIVRRDQAGRILFVNRAFCRAFGLEADHVLGTTFEPDAASDLPATASQVADDALAEDQPQRIKTVDGPRWIVWHSHKIAHSDGIGSDIQSVGRDVTEQRESANELAMARDEAEAANRAKSRFLASMSHEIRTPMNGILGMAGLLSETGPSAEQKTYIEAIDQSARTLLSLIDEILDFSRIEAGRLQIRSEPFDLEACLQSVVELLAPRAHGKDLEIAWTVPPELPRSLKGDEARLRQVLINLVGNAIKFTERGGVHVAIEMNRIENGVCQLQLKVVDTGVGLSADEMSTIFSEFTQGAERKDHNAGGSGLGLAISRKLARAMGGDITVVSQAGQGATFTLEVALECDPGNQEIVHPEGFPAEFTVLLAFNHLVERKAIGELLRASGARVIEVDDIGDYGEITRVAKTSGNIDAIIVDARTDPVVAGHAFQRLAALLDRRDIIGVVLAAASTRTNLRALETVGFRRFLVRPVRPETLFRLLQAGAHGGVRKLGRDSGARTVQTGDGPYQGLRILLAEDNDINALLAETLLAKLGCACERVRDGAQAIAAARKSREGLAPPIDFILMDLSMPQVDGIAAMQAIRAMHADSEVRCPTIIAVTANAYSDDRKNALAQGMDGFVVKPFEPGELTALFDRHAAEVRRSDAVIAVNS